MIMRSARIAGWLLGGLLAICAVLILWPRSAAPLADRQGGFVIGGVRVVDVIAGSIGPPTSVVVRGGLIEAIGDGPPPPGLTRLDGRGRFLVPGYWDMHVHSFQHSPQVEFPLFVARGITSVRDMMDCPGARDSLIACAADKREWNLAIDRGEMTAPRLVGIASYYLENPALTPIQVSARIAAAADRGVDAVKVYNRLPAPAYFRAAAEARQHGLRLVGHLPRAVTLPQAVAAGQSSFEHAHIFARHCFRRSEDWRTGRLDHLAPAELAETMVSEHDATACRAIFEEMVQAGAWYVPTHVTREEDARAADPAFIGDPRLAFLDPLSRWAFRDDLAATRNAYPGVRGEHALRAYFDHGLRLTGEAHRAGVRTLIGTDTAIGGFRYHDEMAHLVRAGLSPAEVLRAATIEAARYAGLERSSGSIEVGKRADLVLLDGDPLADIANAGRIRAVFLNGGLYDRPRLDGLEDFARQQAGAPHNWLKLLLSFARSSVTSDL